MTRPAAEGETTRLEEESEQLTQRGCRRCLGCAEGRGCEGAYAAAIGTILGACVLLGKIAIGDWLTALIALASLGVLFRWQVSNPLLVAATATIGLIALPLLRPAWVFVK